jgi:hypothetical protein
MSTENNQKEQIQQSQQGTGSAENVGQERSEQQQQLNSHLTDEQRQDISGQLGNDSGRLADLSELGQLSGRDDNSGGSNDRMEDQSTGERTDR